MSLLFCSVFISLFRSMCMHFVRFVFWYVSRSCVVSFVVLFFIRGCIRLFCSFVRSVGCSVSLLLCRVVVRAVCRYGVRSVCFDCVRVFFVSVVFLCWSLLRFVGVSCVYVVSSVGIYCCRVVLLLFFQFVCVFCLPVFLSAVCSFFRSFAIYCCCQ